MGGLKQDVTRVVQCQNAIVADRRHEIRADMNIGSRHQLQPNSSLIKRGLEKCCMRPDSGGPVVIDTHLNMRRTSGDGDAIGDRHARHFQRRGQVRRAVVDSMKKVTVKIDHPAISFHTITSLSHGTIVQRHMSSPLAARQKLIIDCQRPDYNDLLIKLS